LNEARDLLSAANIGCRQPFPAPAAWDSFSRPTETIEDRLADGRSRSNDGDRSGGSPRATGNPLNKLSPDHRSSPGDQPSDGRQQTCE
jgi:hypothetical protein